MDYRFQKQALTFMARREMGWDFSNGNELWTRIESAQGTV
jgi:hypothetical protein